MRIFARRKKVLAVLQVHLIIEFIRFTEEKGSPFFHVLVFLLLLSFIRGFPERRIIVDDREENTTAAESLGIRTFLFSVEKNGELEEAVARLLEL